MSFGVHVLVTMFTFFAVSYWGTKEWFDWDELWVSATWNFAVSAAAMMLCSDAL